MPYLQQYQMIHLLKDLDIIDVMPNLKYGYRDFRFSRKQADATFVRETNMWAIPQYSKYEVTKPFFQVYDERYFMGLKPRSGNDGINFTLEMGVQVVPNPMLTKER